MKLDILPIGLYEENTYILHEANHVLLIDPGCSIKQIKKFIAKDEVVDGIVLTHGHEDHTNAVDDVADEYGCKVYMHPGDFMLTDAKLGVKKRGYEAPVFHEIIPLTEGKMIVGKFPLEIICTPGHTAGSVLVRYKQNLFTGDTLFAGSIGRTDLFTGDENAMMHSLMIIKGLPKDLIVYPGHGPSSTIARECKRNYYLQ